MASTLSLDVRQRLGKRRYSPDRQRSPSPSSTSDTAPAREPTRDVHRRLGVAIQDGRGPFSTSPKDKKTSTDLFFVFMLCPPWRSYTIGYTFTNEQITFVLNCNLTSCLQVACGADLALEMVTAAVDITSIGQAASLQVCPPRHGGVEMTEWRRRKKRCWHQRKRRTTRRCRRCGAPWSNRNKSVSATKWKRAGWIICHHCRSRSAETVARSQTPEGEVGGRGFRSKYRGSCLKTPLHSIRLPSARCEVIPSLLEVLDAASLTSKPTGWIDASEFVFIWLQLDFKSK